MESKIAEYIESLETKLKVLQEGVRDADSPYELGYATGQITEIKSTIRVIKRIIQANE